MSFHTWERATSDHGCTWRDKYTDGDESEQCTQPAEVACRGRLDGCDGLEARCRYHLTGADFKAMPGPRHCRYCQSAEHFGDRCPTNPGNRAARSRKRATSQPRPPALQRSQRRPTNGR